MLNCVGVASETLRHEVHSVWGTRIRKSDRTNQQATAHFYATIIHPKNLSLNFWFWFLCAYKRASSVL